MGNKWMLMTMLKTKVNKSAIIFLRVWKKLWLGKTIVIKESKNTRDKYEDGSVSGLKETKIGIAMYSYRS
jgi:hypothetical protein